MLNAGGSTSGGGADLGAAGGAGELVVAAGAAGTGAVAGAGGQPSTGGAGSGAVCHDTNEKAQPLPAFPGAEGFGAFAKGGRGGDVYYVTNLEAAGAGSLAYGIQNAPKTGRTIVFGTSGYANISGTLRVTQPNLTIAGQTAPGDGFALKNGTFLVSASDVIVRHVRFRDGYSADSVDLDSKAINTIWDHCDMLFSHDENMSSFNSPPENLSYQYSINAWGLLTHSAGGLWDMAHATAHHSLWAHNHTRNPKVRTQLLDWINNVTFDWDIGFIMGDSDTPETWRANVRGSYFISTGAKTGALEKASLGRDGIPNFSLFMEDAALDGNANAVLDVSRSDFAIASGTYTKLSAAVPATANYAPVSASNPMIGLPVSYDDHLTAYKKVVSSAGPLRLDVDPKSTLRDELDTLLITDLVTRKRRYLTYGHLDESGATNGGYGTLKPGVAPADADRDGLPDYWERAVGLKPAQDDHNGLLPDCVFGYVPGGLGYTNLEDYLQWLAIPHGVVARRRSGGAETFLDVDLRKFTAGLGASTTYVVRAPVHGTVSVQADGHTARFVPEPEFTGRAGFAFAGTDEEKSSIGFDVGVLVAENLP